MAGTTRDGATQRQRKPTQADVANLARVSPAIVSAVVNERPAGNIRVSDATRQRVRAAVRQLGYVPNIAARNLAHGRNHILGVFSYEPVFPLESVNFYHEFLVGIEEEAESAGYNLLMFTAAKRNGGARSVYADGVNSLQLADGAVLVGSHERHDEIVQLAGEKYPFVIVGRRDFPGADVSFAAADYAGGARDAVHALFERGHRRIALARGMGDHESAIDRYTGFLRGRRECGLAADDTPIWRLQDDVPTAPLADQLAAAGVTAVVTESTSLARAVRMAARRAKLAIPRQLSLLDLGGAVSPLETPDISTLVLPRRDMGRQAVQLLLKLLDDPAAAPLQSTLSCRLELTRTVGPPPA
ncbi:MAG TPA: LacI family DNA-binding transcriptional regulator [Mycobacteriales bacterium]|jgi:DNA-binding LacI/PurR family transcriptional regulator|nr:LacI family DNA-binding transcriptional regulator [Mycobacteriales bacterium]